MAATTRKVQSVRYNNDGSISSTFNEGMMKVEAIFALAMEVGRILSENELQTRVDVLYTSWLARTTDDYISPFERAKAGK